MATLLLIDQLQEHYDNNSNVNYKWFWAIAATDYSIDKFINIVGTDKNIIKDVFFETDIDKRGYEQVQAFMSERGIEYEYSLGEGKYTIPDSIFKQKNFKVMFYPVRLNASTFLDHNKMD